MNKQIVINEAIETLREELTRALEKHGPMASPHEGYAVIAEELDELWDHVKGNTGRGEAAIKEAMQVAAMGLRYAIDMSQ